MKSGCPVDVYPNNPPVNHYGRTSQAHEYSTQMRRPASSAVLPIRCALESALLTVVEAFHALTGYFIENAIHLVVHVRVR